MAKSIAIIAGSYHKNHVVKMVEEARSVALDNGLTVEEVKWVPGSMEMPLQIKRQTQSYLKLHYELLQPSLQHDSYDNYLQ
jgi:6,7-dimethyl-8-ribityllumazine synthase